MDKQEIIAALRRDLEYVAAERRSVKRIPEMYAARVVLRQFQADRMARTHADLLADTETRAAARFFLDDLYGSHDLSGRDTDLERALPSFERLLPAPALAGVAEAMALDALSERLDAKMAARLGTQFKEEEYADAYRNVGSRSDRERQLEHVERLGAALSELVHVPLIGKTLTMMKVPARLAGVEHLQRFLDRGFKAFAAMKCPRDFVTKVVVRERLIMDRLYGGQPDPFGMR